VDKTAADLGTGKDSFSKDKGPGTAGILRHKRAGRMIPNKPVHSLNEMESGTYARRMLEAAKKGNTIQRICRVTVLPDGESSLVFNAPVLAEDERS
jgi:hypothetical protein